MDLPRCGGARNSALMRCVVWSSTRRSGLKRANICWYSCAHLLSRSLLASFCAVTSLLCRCGTRACAIK